MHGAPQWRDSSACAISLSSRFTGLGYLDREEMDHGTT